jgi:hypothetical protein
LEACADLRSSRKFLQHLRIKTEGGAKLRRDPNPNYAQKAGCFFMVDVVPTWNGISGRTVSSTLRELANFLIAKNIGPNITETMQSWLADGGVIGQLWQATTDEQLDELLSTERPQGYWPGRLTPTLMELQELLEFLVYRDRIEGVENSPVKHVMQGLMAFRAFEGSCHCAHTGHYSDTYAFINVMPHHPSEVYSYIPTGKNVHEDPNVEFLMIFRWTWNAWHFDDADQKWLFTKRLGGQRDKSQRLSYEYERIKAMLSRIGILNDCFKVLPYYGATYGEDAVQVSLTRKGYQIFQQEKRNRYSS